MATLTIRLPDDKHERLKTFAKSRGISINKLMEELSTIALAEFDTFTRFKAMAATGDPQAGLQLLDKLDAMTEEKPQHRLAE
ncbi:MAG: CopG family transcriptional regulator [Cyanobacteria bacterium J06634_6]